MGYEIKMIVVRPAGFEEDEYEYDLTKPFEDGSGYDYKYDTNGKPVLTGRKEIYAGIIAEINLCKLGYQDDALNRLIAQSHAKGNSMSKKVRHYFFGTDGNTKINRDCYGNFMWPVPIADVLQAMKDSLQPDDPYRRLLWAIALLESMSATDNEFEVMFYGY